MISSFIAHGLTETDLVAESVMQILAGGETPATGFRSTLLFIITNPRVYATLQKEIDNALKTDGMISRPVVKDREWRQLEYLQAVVREGLRLCPPVTGLLSKVSPAGGDKFVVDGERVFIPGGTNIGWACCGMYRDKAVFGEDAELYRPERWLEEQNQDKLERMRKVVDLNFGYGKYYCLGRQVALSEMHKGVFEVRNELKNSRDTSKRTELIRRVVVPELRSRDCKSCEAMEEPKLGVMDTEEDVGKSH